MKIKLLVILLSFSYSISHSQKVFDYYYTKGPNLFYNDSLIFSCKADEYFYTIDDYNRIVNDYIIVANLHESDSTINFDYFRINSYSVKLKKSVILKYTDPYLRYEVINNVHPLYLCSDTFNFITRTTYMSFYKNQVLYTDKKNIYLSKNSTIDTVLKTHGRIGDIYNGIYCPQFISDYEIIYIQNTCKKKEDGILSNVFILNLVTEEQREIIKTDNLIYIKKLDNNEYLLLKTPFKGPFNKELFIYYFKDGEEVPMNKECSGIYIVD